MAEAPMEPTAAHPAVMPTTRQDAVGDHLALGPVEGAANPA